MNAPRPASDEARRSNNLRATAAQMGATPRQSAPWPRCTGCCALAADWCSPPNSTAIRWWRADRSGEWGWRAWTEPELQAVFEKTGFSEVRLSHDAQGTFATAIKPQ